MWMIPAILSLQQSGFQNSFQSLLFGTTFTQRGYKSRSSSPANSQKPWIFNARFLTVLLSLKFLTVKIGGTFMVVELQEKYCENIWHSAWCQRSHKVLAFSLWRDMLLGLQNLMLCQSLTGLEQQWGSWVCGDEKWVGWISYLIKGREKGNVVLLTTIYLAFSRYCILL